MLSETYRMINLFIDELVSPTNKLRLSLKNDLLIDVEGNVFPVINDIPRFVSMNNYSSSFGFQWNIFENTQIDSANSDTISRDRFYSSTRWSHELRGFKILEVGSGSGRFTEVVLETGAIVYSIDYSNAVEANYRNNGHCKNLFLCQASVYEMPFKDDFFDKIFCLGVIQHTPDVEKSFVSMLQHLKPGGEIVIDVYAKTFKTKFYTKYWVRMITKRINKEKLLAIIKWYVPKWLPFSNLLIKVPYIGKFLAQIIPVCNYSKQYPDLSNKQLEEWAILDTFDMLSPEFDHPQSIYTLKKWIKKYNLQEVFCGRGENGFVLIAKKRCAA